MSRLVNAKSVSTASLHIYLPKYRHLYVAPFVFVFYPLWLYVYLMLYEQLLGNREYTFLSLVLLVSLHGLTFLAGEWNTTAKAFLTSKKTNDPYKATVIRVIPTPHTGAGALCPIEQRKDPKADRGLRLFFTFQREKFVFDENKKQFNVLPYPVDLPMREYISGSGLSKAVAEASENLYGSNVFDIPVPTFLSLFKEHAIAPFFVFQVFTVVLWLLDEYWYYSLFTLGMLFLFEFTVVAQRLRTIQEFHNMSQKPYPIHVYRDGHWTSISSTHLLPGDLVYLTRTLKEEHVVPCDLLLLSGSVIVNEAMLSGESTPLQKESIQTRSPDEFLNMDEDRIHMVYAGTKVLQVARDGEGEDVTAFAALQTAPLSEHGALAYVLQTGFGTAQGKLVRMMFFSSERVSVHNKESILFILFLIIFALFAAHYVWVNGQKHAERSTSKLLLDCILIITSVVPPELPMELSMAVNASLLSLSKLHIFCTEPFRIPFAGKLDILCLDKTGTITSEDMVVEGVAGVSKDVHELIPVHAAPLQTILVLASAHALVKLEKGTDDNTSPLTASGKNASARSNSTRLVSDAASEPRPDSETHIIGDPMECVTLQAIRFDLKVTDVVVSKQPGAAFEIHILRKFPFSSALKRMSTISRMNTLSNQLLVSVKGAPEVIEKMLTKVPSDYEATHKYLSLNGGRVLALAWKHIQASPKQASQLHRESVEDELTFAGFLVFSCPLKKDSADSLVELMQSSHRCVMITGDHALTACHVARQIKLISKPILILEGDLHWYSDQGSKKYQFDHKEVSQLALRYDLCITGGAFSRLDHEPWFSSILPYIYVWARVSPGEKETILKGLKQEGFTTLMCGDGTNDVGALKQAHVGVALLDTTPEELAKIAMYQQYKTFSGIYIKQCELASRFGGVPPAKPAILTQLESRLNIQPVSLPPPPPPNSAANNRPNLSPLELMGQMPEDVPTLKLGDASMAAPFTSKLSTLSSLCHIVKQGRCTLVTTLQMYKILALNSLISAYTMSVLFLEGMKWGDWQMTIQGLLVAICFFCISKGQPLSKLSKERPQSKFFTLATLASILCQLAVHLVALTYVIQLVQSHIDTPLKVDFENKETFSPNLLNTGIYLLNLSMQVTTFAVNYEGHPFRESIRENTVLFRGLLGVGVIALAAALELSPELNALLELVPFPTGVSETLVMVMLLDSGVSFAVEALCRRLLVNTRTRKELRLN